MLCLLAKSFFACLLAYFTFHSNMFLCVIVVIVLLFLFSLSLSNFKFELELNMNSNSNSLRFPRRLLYCRRLTKLAHPSPIRTSAENILTTRLGAPVSTRSLSLHVNLTSHLTYLSISVSIGPHFLGVHCALDILKSLEKLLVFPCHLLLHVENKG